MDKKLFEDKLAQLGIELRQPARQGPRMGERRAIFPKPKSCRWTLRAEKATTEQLRHKCKNGKNYYYGQAHILMRCDGCKIRRHIQFKFPKRH